jgi:ABC-type sugar transport system ATPase subunit
VSLAGERSITIPSALSAEGVSKRFGGVRALEDVSLELRSGEVHVLAGENGAGKSTLIKILSGALQPDEGRVLLRGELARFRSPQDASARGVSVIHQELSLVDSLSVADNFFLGRELTRGPGWLDRRRQEARAREACRRAGLDLDVRREAGSYPLGVRAQLEIARALDRGLARGDAGALGVLILDEPTSALTRPEAERLFERVAGLKARGFAIAYITHRMEEIYRLADRITVLRDGRSVGTWETRELPEAELVGRMVGRRMVGRAPAGATASRPGALVEAPERLRVRGLRVAGTRVEGLDLDVRAGETLGIAGLQGAGAEEVLEALFGARKGTVGELRVDGVEARPVSPARAIRAGLAWLPSDRKARGIVPGMGVRGNATLASLVALSPWGWIRARRERARAEARVAALGIRCSSVEQPVGTLSGGNQQKVLIARWLEARPKVVLLAEPTRGVDVGARREIYELLRRLTAEGAALVVVSTDLPELLELSDRVVVLHRGRRAAEFPRAEATAEKILRAAMGGAA